MAAMILSRSERPSMITAPDDRTVSHHSLGIFDRLTLGITTSEPSRVSTSGGCSARTQRGSVTHRSQDCRVKWGGPDAHQPVRLFGVVARATGPPGFGKAAAG